MIVVERPAGVLEPPLSMRLRTASGAPIPQLDTAEKTWVLYQLTSRKTVLERPAEMFPDDEARLTFQEGDAPVTTKGVYLVTVRLTWYPDEDTPRTIMVPTRRQDKFLLWVH